MVVTFLSTGRMRKRNLDPENLSVLKFSSLSNKDVFRIRVGFIFTLALQRESVASASICRKRWRKMDEKHFSI